jgi:hypothetical protein
VTPYTDIAYYLLSAACLTILAIKVRAPGIKHTLDFLKRWSVLKELLTCALCLGVWVGAAYALVLTDGRVSPTLAKAVAFVPIAAVAAHILYLAVDILDSVAAILDLRYKALKKASKADKT